MNAASPHSEELQNALAAEAVGALEPDEHARLLAHLKTCEECSRELAALRDAAALLGLALPQIAMNPANSTRMRARLVARAAADLGHVRPGGGNGVAAGTRAGAALRRQGWAGWAVAAGLAALLVTHHAFHRPVAFGWLSAGVFALLFVVATLYALAQRDRAATLRDRLTAAERERRLSPPRIGVAEGELRGD